jgi:hypothetical protein
MRVSQPRVTNTSMASGKLEFRPILRQMSAFPPSRSKISAPDRRLPRTPITRSINRGTAQFEERAIESHRKNVICKGLQIASGDSNGSVRNFQDNQDG